MIVTCPACSSRYQFDEERLDGRSAKITCPSCGHVYIVHPPRIEPALVSETWPSEAMGEAEAESIMGEDTVPAEDIRTADFTRHGVTWKVRQGLGLVHDFRSLEELQDALDDGVIGRMDELSYDGRTFTRIAQIDDLEALFKDVWDRAVRGEVTTHEAQHFVIGGEGEGDEDAPTTIVRTGNAFSLDLDAPPDPEAEAEGGDHKDEPAPPPPAPLSVVPSADTPDAPTEDAGQTDDEPHQEAAAVPPTPRNAAAAPAQPEDSRLPLVLLVVVIVIVLLLILWRQGMFDALVGG